MTNPALKIANREHARRLLRQLKLIPDDLVDGVSDARWPAAIELIDVVARELGVAELRGANREREHRICPHCFS